MDVAGQAVQVPWLTHCLQAFKHCCQLHSRCLSSGLPALSSETVAVMGPSGQTIRAHQLCELITMATASAGAQHHREHQQERVHRVPAGQGQGVQLYA